jgi:chromosome segregation ATPase
MTTEEMERAIEFLLKHQADYEIRQARLETQMERTSRQIEETNKHLEMYAETQTQFIEIVTRHIEEQGKINASIRASLARTDERVSDLEQGNGNS